MENAIQGDWTRFGPYEGEEERFSARGLGRSTYDQFGRPVVSSAESLLHDEFLASVYRVLDGMVAALLLAVLRSRRSFRIHAFDFALVLALQVALRRVPGLEGLLRLLQRSWLMRVRCTHRDFRDDCASNFDKLHPSLSLPSLKRDFFFFPSVPPPGL